MFTRRCLAILIALSPLWLARVDLAQAPPAAPRRPVVDTYHGIKVTDDYRWLEDWNNPETQAWSNAENAAARKYLNALKGRGALRAQLQSILSKTSASFSDLRNAGGVWFALSLQPPKEQPVLVALQSLDDASSARTLVDPTKLDPSGHTAIDFFVPSRDGKFVAVSLSKGGSEAGNLSIFDAVSGNMLADKIPHVNNGTAGRSVAWKADGSGFYYTRYPAKGERPDADLDFYQQVWFHRMGTESRADTYSLGENFSRIAEIQLQQSAAGGYILASVQNGDGGEYAHYLLGPDGKWIAFAGFGNQVTAAYFGQDGFLYLISRQNAPKGKILKVALSDVDLARAKMIVSESGISLEELVPAAGHLYVSASTEVLRSFEFTI